MIKLLIGKTLKSCFKVCLNATLLLFTSPETYYVVQNCFTSSFLIFALLPLQGPSVFCLPSSADRDSWFVWTLFEWILDTKKCISHHWSKLYYVSNDNVEDVLHLNATNYDECIYVYSWLVSAQRAMLRKQCTAREAASFSMLEEEHSASAIL